MKKDDHHTNGLKNLIAMYRKAFHLPENINYYTEQDFKSAERQFIKFMLQNRELSNAPPKHM
jgi:hypothetical protein